MASVSMPTASPGGAMLRGAGSPAPEAPPTASPRRFDPSRPSGTSDAFRMPPSEPRRRPRAGGGRVTDPRSASPLGTGLRFHADFRVEANESGVIGRSRRATEREAPCRQPTSTRGYG